MRLNKLIILSFTIALVSCSNKSSDSNSEYMGIVNGHEYVDLGLPSGLKWATCNVGAKEPENCGEYFDWGEIYNKKEFTEEDCDTYGKNISWLRSNGYVDAKDNLTKEYDVACKRWGSTWRMPTRSELRELVNNTTQKWTSMNGVEGCKLTSKHNGQSIFLPAGGWRYGFEKGFENANGSYWSSTPTLSGTEKSYYLLIYEEGSEMGLCQRYVGFSVRPVTQ